MAELRVRVLVHAPVAVHGEVAPHVRRAAEVQLPDGARRRLETLLGVLCRDTTGDHVALRGYGGRRVEVDAIGPFLILSVESADIPDAVEGNPHRDLQLRSG